MRHLEKTFCWPDAEDLGNAHRPVVLQELHGVRIAPGVLAQSLDIWAGPSCAPRLGKEHFAVIHLNEEAVWGVGSLVKASDQTGRTIEVLRRGRVGLERAKPLLHLLDSEQGAAIETSVA